jgi:hypothetical protein
LKSLNGQYSTGAFPGILRIAGICHPLFQTARGASHGKVSVPNFKQGHRGREKLAATLEMSNLKYRAQIQPAVPRINSNLDMAAITPCQDVDNKPHKVEYGHRSHGMAAWLCSVYSFHMVILIQRAHNRAIMSPSDPSTHTWQENLFKSLGFSGLDRAALVLKLC